MDLLSETETKTLVIELPTEKKSGRPRKYDKNDTELIKKVKTEQNKKYYETRGYYTNKIKYYIKGYNLSISQADYYDKPIEELKTMILNIETEINNIRLNKLEEKNKNKIETLLKKREEKLKMKEEKLLQKLDKQKEKKTELITKKIVEKMNTDINLPTDKPYKPKQIKLKN